MTLVEFDERLRTSIHPGTVFNNPGGGVSEVLSIRNGKISYRRGSSTIAVALTSLYDAFVQFKGKQVSAPELRILWPSVFDSTARPAGHSCNVTFLFLCLKQMGIVSEVQGRGVRGSPYFVDLRS